MRLAWGIEEHLGEYLTANFPDLAVYGMYKPDLAVGFVNNDDRLVGALGMIMLNAFDGSLSIFMDRPCFTASILRELYNKVFIDMNLVRLTCHVSKRNRKARLFVEHMGFRMEGVKRRGFDGVHDAVVYGMLKNECRWLGDH